MCRKLRQTDTPISSHKLSPPVASNLPRPTTQRHWPLTFSGPRNVARTSARPRGAENEHFLLSVHTPQPRRRHDQSGQTSSPIPTLHDHGPNSLTLATVRVSSYPKPYGPPQPYYRARVTTPNPSDGSRRGKERSKATPDLGGAMLPDTPTEATDLPRPQKRGQNFSETSRCRDRSSLLSHGGATTRVATRCIGCPT